MKVNDLMKYIIPPLSIYACVFLFISALIGAKVNQETLWVWLVTLTITVVGLLIATRYVSPKNWNEGLKYGTVWLVVLFVLDLILTIPFTGLDYFSDWRSYLPYLLTVLLPTSLGSIQQK